jgi:tetratricopeptide (TPR) repeat protein
MPQEFVALINLANVYDELGQDRDADRTYQAIIAFYPEAPEGYFNWGVYHERRGRIGTAKDLYRKALQVDESYQRAAERISILADDGPRALKPLTRP